MVARRRFSRLALAVLPHRRTVGSLSDAGNGGPQSDRVLQAQGMISVQRGCGMDEAFDLLREKAFVLGQTLEYTALDVLDHIIRFD